MAQQDQTPNNTTQGKGISSPYARFVLAGIALGLAYVAVSRAIDTGSLLEYTVALVLFILGIRDLMRGIQGLKKRKS